MACGSCDLIMGNLNEQSFEEIWNGPRYREFRRVSSRPGGQVSLDGSCECANCCLVKDNLSVHRVYKYLAPLADRAAGRVRAG